MPPVLEASCSACGHAELVPATVGAVIVDRPEQARFPSAHDPLLALLPHPLESGALEATGFSYGRAAWEGRLLELRPVSCRGCGRIFEIRRVVWAPNAGCAPVLAVGAVAGILAGAWLHSMWTGLVVSLLVWAGLGPSLDRVLEHLIRRRHAERVRQIEAAQSCPGCGDARWFEAGRPTRGLKCPKCGDLNLGIEMTGIS